MALDMYLELSIDASDWEKAKSLLYGMGMDQLEEHRPDAIWGSISNGAVFTEATWNRPRRTNEIMAEGHHGCKFLVNGLISFRVNNSMYDEAVATIKKFLSLLSDETNASFVLSFQLEEVRATRDQERGFEWFWNDPR